MQTVSQVSLPMRIALAATLAFFAIWFVALRPKPPSAGGEPATPTPTPAAAQSAPGKAAAQAQQAADASQQSAAQHEQAAGTTSGTTSGTDAASGTATAPGQPAAKPSAALKQSAEASKAALSVLQDLVRGKVVVLLFWDGRLSDDRAVHSAVQGLDRRDGKVAVHVASVRNLALYEPITRGVPVVTSPTVLIIDRAGRARSVGGLSVRDELDELVGKALKVKP